MILVTGASGFVGSALIEALGAPVRAAYRALPPEPRSADVVVVGDLGPHTDWSRALEGVAGIVHLAGPAHAKHANAALRCAIVEGTAALVEQAARAGVKRFVFVSSVKAAIARTRGEPVSETAPPAPEDYYGRAKLEAERAVLAHAAMRPVVLRPPLVFASHAKGNFARLLQLADTPLPLPLGGIENRRSLISLASLNAAICATLRTPAGPSGVFYVADKPALSTSAMLAALRAGMGRPVRLFRAPALGALAPRALTESLVIDDSAFRAAYSAAAADAGAALAACAAAWRLRSREQ